MLEDLDVEVARRSTRRSSACRAAREDSGHRVPEFTEAARASIGGGISPPEAYAVHRKWVDRDREIDPRVL